MAGILLVVASVEGTWGWYFLENIMVSVKEGREEKSHFISACAYSTALLWQHHRGHHNFSAMMEAAMTLSLLRRLP